MGLGAGNGRGGPRPNSGRKSAFETQFRALPGTAELILRGLTPLEIMVIQMRKSWGRVLEQQELIDNKDVATAEELKTLYDLEMVAFGQAKECAPYVHPKLTSVSTQGDTSEIANGGMVVQQLKYDDRL